MKLVRNIAIGVIAIYLLLLINLALFQRVLIYPAPTNTPELADANLSGFNIVQYQTSDGLILTGWYGVAKDKPTIIIFHGNAGDLAQRANFARSAHKEGYGVLLVSYRGYPPNGGNPTEEGLYRDAIAAKEVLNKKDIDDKNIIVMGASIGSGPATELAAQMAKAGTPAHTLLLEVPFTNLAAPALVAYPYLPVSWLLRDRFDNISKITSINTSLCILGAGDDRVVPNVQAHALFEAAKEPRYIYIVDGAPHNGVLKDNEATFRLALNCIERKKK